MENNIMWINGQRYFSEDYIVECMVRHALSLRQQTNTVRQTEAESRTIITHEIFVRHYLGDYRMRQKFQDAYVKARYLTDNKIES